MLDFYFCRNGDLMVVGSQENIVQSPFVQIAMMIKHFYVQEKVCCRLPSHLDAIDFLVERETFYHEPFRAVHTTWVRQLTSFLKHYQPETGKNITEHFSRNTPCYVNSAVAKYSDDEARDLLNIVATFTNQEIAAMSGPEPVFESAINDGFYEDFLENRKNKNFYDHFKTWDEHSKLFLLGYAYHIKKIRELTINL